MFNTSLIGRTRRPRTRTCSRPPIPRSSRAPPTSRCSRARSGSADTEFLAELYRRGIAGSYDGLAIHPYNEWRAPDDRWQEQWRQFTFLPGIDAIRNVQRANGDDTPLWVTEFGWTTSTGGWASVPGPSTIVTEQQQAQYIETAFARLAEMPYVRSAVVYNLRNRAEGRRGWRPNVFNDNFGLVGRDFTPKPAYWALQRALGGNRTQ